MAKGVVRDFYPFVEKDEGADSDAQDAQSMPCEALQPARIAVYDDASAAPRVVLIEPCEVRDYLEQITGAVNKLSHEQGGTIPFMVIREIVENFIHAYFQAPTITILDGGNTIRFSDQGPGIKEKKLALEYGTSSATEDMKHYIRGVGSGLPYAQQYMVDKGGSLQIEDNIAGGTVVTISTHPKDEARVVSKADGGDGTDDERAAGGMPTSGPAGMPGGTMGAQPFSPWGPWGAAMPQGAQPAMMPSQMPWPGAGTLPYQQVPSAAAGQVPGAQPQGEAWGTQGPGTWPAMGGMPAPTGQPQAWGPGTAGQWPAQPWPSPTMGAAQPQGGMPGSDAGSMPGAMPGAPFGQVPGAQAMPGQPGAASQQGAPLSPATAAGTGQAPQAADVGYPTIQLRERDRQTLGFMAEHELVGPTDLVQAFGSSGATWSRVLNGLATQGLAIKTSQKYKLTEVGWHFAS